MSRKRKFNQYDLSGSCGIGITSNTGSKFYFDLEDYDLIKDYCWCEHTLVTGYRTLEAWSSAENKAIRMSWLIFGKNADHINRNPLDNRKANLRQVTQRQNVFNRSIQKNNKSGIIGVRWLKDRSKWSASIRVNGKSIHLGFYQNFNDAIKKRLEAEAVYFGSYAPQSHLFGAYGVEIGDVSK